MSIKAFRIIASALIAAAGTAEASGAPQPVTVEVVTPQPLTVEVVAPRRSRSRKNAKPLPAPTQSADIPKIDDPLDKVLEHYRNENNSIPGVVQYHTYSFKIIRVISDNEGIFAVHCRSEINSAATRERVIDNPKVAEVYIKGFDLSERADREIIPLKNGATLWRIGVYRKGRRSYPKYTTDRNEAQEYARSRRKKTAQSSGE